MHNHYLEASNLDRQKMQMWTKYQLAPYFMEQLQQLIRH